MSDQPFRSKCVHCSASMLGRSSRRYSPTTSVVYFRCTNDDCGARYAATLEITHMISPSFTPNPDCGLPLRPPMWRKAPTPIPANDVDDGLAVREA